MSEAEAAGQADNLEEDCPLCLEPLPPFWDTERRAVTSCCGGKSMCKDCYDKQNEYLDRAQASGSQEEQLGSTCPLCRSPLLRKGDDAGEAMKDKFEKGQLPLHMYCNLAGEFVNGEGRLEMNVERGIEIMKLGAEKGDPRCQYFVGCKYREGADGFPNSTTEAKRWYLAATEQGHAIAESCLAFMAEDEGNDAEYLRYLRSSASKGYEEACYNLGLSHYLGEHGLQKSSEKAIRSLTPAAERGHARSMGLLGFAMCCPEPEIESSAQPQTNPNFTKGVHWMQRAAENGHESSVSNLESLKKTVGSACFMCDKRAPPDTVFLLCVRCRAAWYCSKDCQRRHWKAKEGGHKHFCIKWNEGR